MNRREKRYANVACHKRGNAVRNRPDSDLDLRIFPEEFGHDRQTTMWWTRQNETCFAELKSQLSGRLEIHRDSPEKGDEYIEAVRAGKASPTLKIGKVVCVWTPPKP